MGRILVVVHCGYSLVNSTVAAGAIIKTLLLTFSLTAILAAPVQANSNLRAMNNSAFSRFGNADLALLRTQIDKAVAAGVADGQAFEWKSDKSRASGQVTALARNQFKGLDCRNLRIQNSWGNQRDDGVFRFCEKPAGQWRLIGPVLD